jgi:hypothetical protein
MFDPPRKVTATVLIDISEDDDLSNAFQFGDEFTRLAVETPSAWTAADILFFGSSSYTGTYLPVSISNGNPATLVGGASELIAATGTTMDAIAPIKYLKLGTSAAQLADRTLIVHMSTD